MAANTKKLAVDKKLAASKQATTMRVVNKQAVNKIATGMLVRPAKCKDYWREKLEQAEFEVKEHL